MNVKEFYLWLVRCVSMLWCHRRRDAVVYLLSFNDNLPFILAVKAALPADQPLIVFYRPQQATSAQYLAQQGVRTILFRDGLRFALTGIPRVMRARVLYCDNYYAFLGGLAHPRNMRIVQLWHAVGAIKKFGWEDPTTPLRSASDQRRFQAVYDHFDEYVVASPAMGQVFTRSYRVPAHRMQVLGYPRSDRLLSPQWVAQARAKVARVAPELMGSRVILYAPTYRPGVTLTPPQDLAQALTADPQAKVVVKLHPALAQTATTLQAQLGTQVVVADQLSTSELLTVTETLVTDYSSVAFDYSLLANAHSLLFYLFDLSAYQREPGIQADFLSWLPGRALRNSQELAAAIIADQTTDLRHFNQQWNTANDGQATARVVARYHGSATRGND